MKDKKLIIILFILAVLFVAIGIIYTQTTKTAGETFLISPGFDGRFRVVYGEKCGIMPEYENGRMLLRIPGNGVLIIQPKHGRGNIKAECYVVDGKGERKKINEHFERSRELKQYVHPLLDHIHVSFSDFYAYNKDTVGTAGGTGDLHFDSLTYVLVNRCRGNN